MLRVNFFKFLILNLKNHITESNIFMFKFFLIILYLFCLNNCTAPGTALIGPAITGATSKSLAQASVSFGTNQIFSKIRQTSEKGKNEVKKIVKKIENFNIKSKSKNLLTYKIVEIEISEVLEPEPLP